MQETQHHEHLRKDCVKLEDIVTYFKKKDGNWQECLNHFVRCLTDKDLESCISQAQMHPKLQEFEKWLFTSAGSDPGENKPSFGSSENQWTELEELLLWLVRDTVDDSDVHEKQTIQNETLDGEIDKMDTDIKDLFGTNSPIDVDDLQCGGEELPCSMDSPVGINQAEMDSDFEYDMDKPYKFPKPPGPAYPDINRILESTAEVGTWFQVVTTYFFTLQITKLNLAL